MVLEGRKKRLHRMDSARTTLAATRPNTLVCFTGGDPSLTTRYSGGLPREVGASAAASGAAGGVVRSRAVGGKHGFSGATSRPGGRTGGDSRLVGLNLKTIETALCRSGNAKESACFVLNSGLTAYTGNKNC